MTIKLVSGNSCLRNEVFDFKSWTQYNGNLYVSTCIHIANLLLVSKQ